MTMSDMTNVNEPTAEPSGISTASAGPAAGAVVPDDLVDQVMAKLDAEGLELIGADGVLAQLTKAVLRMPPSRRARSTCSSASLIVPLRPSTSRSLKLAGW